VPSGLPNGHATGVEFLCRGRLRRRRPRATQPTAPADFLRRKFRCHRMMPSRGDFLLPLPRQRGTHLAITFSRTRSRKRPQGTPRGPLLASLTRHRRKLRLLPGPEGCPLGLGRYPPNLPKPGAFFFALAARSLASLVRSVHGKVVLACVVGLVRTSLRGQLSLPRRCWPVRTKAFVAPAVAIRARGRLVRSLGEAFP
jgi:hypothetical protein